MEIRFAAHEEMCQVEELWSYCFEKRQDAFFAWYFANYARPEYVLGAFAQNELAGMIHLNPYRFCLHGRELDTSYFVGVATAPAHRRQGVMRSMLKEAFAILRGHGQSQALLMPVMAGIYLPYGFAYCYGKLKYQLPLRELAMSLPKVSGLEVILAKAEDTDIFSEIYESYTKGLNGFILRGVKEWGYIFGDFFAAQDENYAVFVKNQVGYCGYMLYSIKDNVFKIVELIALSAEAKIALLSYAGEHLSQCEDFLWLAPEDDLTYLKFPLNRYYPTMQPFMMARTLDPCRAVADLQPDVPEELSLAVRIVDNIMEENNRVFLLSEVNGRAELTAADMQAQVEIEIGAFTQLCFGAFSARALYKSGAIRAKDYKEIEMLEKVFVKKVNYINEYF